MGRVLSRVFKEERPGLAEDRGGSTAVGGEVVAPRSWCSLTTGGPQTCRRRVMGAKMPWEPSSPRWVAVGKEAQGGLRTPPWEAGSCLSLLGSQDPTLHSRIGPATWRATCQLVMKSFFSSSNPPLESPRNPESQPPPWLCHSVEAPPWKITDTLCSFCLELLPWEGFPFGK